MPCTTSNTIGNLSLTGKGCFSGESVDYVKWLMRTTWKDYLGDNWTDVYTCGSRGEAAAWDEEKGTEPEAVAPGFNPGSDFTI